MKSKEFSKEKGRLFPEERKLEPGMAAAACYNEKR